MTSSTSTDDTSGVTSTDGGGQPGTTDGEVAQLRAEVSTLQARLDARERRASAVRAVRRVAAAVLVALAAFALVNSVVGVWAARTALNTDRWVATVAPLPRDPQVAAAVAEYATTQVFEVLDAEQRIRDALPPRAAFIAGPLTGQLRQTVRTTVDNVLRSDGFQTIWIELNRRAHLRALAIVEGTSDVAVVRENRVDLDLLPLINEVLRTLSTDLPTLFGKELTLPNLSSGALPENLRTRIEDAVGVPLPANFAQFTFYDGGQLQAVQQSVVTAKRDLALFVAGSIVLLVAALLVSYRRRRTLLQLGVWLVIAAVAVTAVLRAVRREILAEVPPGVYRDGVGATMTVVFGSLRERGVQLIWIGALLAAVAYLMGPGRFPVWLRHRTVWAFWAAGRGLKAGATAAVPWIAEHRDAARIAGVVVAAILALISASWTALLVILVVLAGYEVAVTLAARTAAREPTSSDGEAGGLADA